MKKLLNTIFALTIVVGALSSCGDKPKTDEKKLNDIALNKEYDDQHADYQKEQVAMSEEHKEFEDLFNAMKTEHARVASAPTAKYDTLVTTQQRLLDQHSKMVSENVVFLTEHGEIVKQHAENKISDKEIQNKSVEFHKKHKKSSDDHDALVKKYEELNKKHSEFITKAGGKIDFASKKAAMEADTTKK